MKAFIASSWENRDEMAEYARRLRLLGHDVTSTWHEGLEETRHFHAGVPKGDEHFEFNHHLAHQDINDVHRCDTLIYVPVMGRLGHHTELGMAIAWNKDIVLIGERMGLYAYHCSVEQYDTWEDFFGHQAETSSSARQDNEEVQTATEVRKRD